MTKTKISAEVVADSLSPQGDRLTSLVLTYPRIIHSEMMTHRMFSRNASSSRAVPVDKMIKAVKENTFCPFEFQKSHKGMQGSEYFTGVERQECINLWLESAELALQQAEKMKAKGISKQIINRILEPYQYYTVLITGSKEGWDNFFELRNSVYIFHDLDGDNKEYHFKSKRDVIKRFGESEWVEGEYDKPLKNLTKLDWHKLNKGQAEIHMMMLSEKIYDVMNESTPEQLSPGMWHIPFLSKIDSSKLKGKTGKEVTSEKIKISTALSARTSYTVIGNEREVDYQKMIELHDRLITQNPPHSSPMEHCARAMSDEEYQSFRKGEHEVDLIDNSEESHWHIEADSGETGWCLNFRGFIQYRHLVEKDLIYKRP